MFHVVVLLNDFWVYYYFKNDDTSLSLLQDHAPVSASLLMASQSEIWIIINNNYRYLCILIRLWWIFSPCNVQIYIKFSLFVEWLTFESTYEFLYLIFAAIPDTESQGECYEELESSYSGSAVSSNVSRTYSNSLPATNRQRFSFFFGNTLIDPKNKELRKTCSDATDFNHGRCKICQHFLLIERIF